MFLDASVRRRQKLLMVKVQSGGGDGRTVVHMCLVGGEGHVRIDVGSRDVVVLHQHLLNLVGVRALMCSGGVGFVEVLLKQLNDKSNRCSSQLSAHLRT